PDPGVTTYKDERARYDPAAQHPVQLADAGLTSLIVIRSHFCEGQYPCIADGITDRPRRRRRPLRDTAVQPFLHKCIPLSAGRALPQPFRPFMPAVLAEKYTLL